MMRAITALTAAYIVVMATTMFHTSSADSKFSGIVFGEVLFSSPIILAYVLARLLNGVVTRSIMLLFGLAFSVFTLLVFWSTFTGEHDAQYQLTLLFIPLVGVPAAAIAGAIAALWNWRARQTFGS